MSGTRSILRPWRSDDAQWYIDQITEAEIQQFTTESPETSVSDFKSALRLVDASPDMYCRAITDPAYGQLAGNLAVTREGNVACVSYWVAEAFRGYGLVRRAVEEASRYVEVNWLDVDLLHVSIHADNVASLRVAAALGFVRDPSRDKVIRVRGEQWPMTSYVRRVSR